MTELAEDEALRRIRMMCGPEAFEWVGAIIADRDAARQEVVRLLDVIDGHARVVSDPITEQYSADCQRIRDPQNPFAEAGVRLTPHIHRVKLPTFVDGWSVDHRMAFLQEASSAIGLKVAKSLVAELWPISLPIDEVKP